jgi:3-oxoacyl-[acyl-carrier-protein] synthase III
MFSIRAAAEQLPGILPFNAVQASERNIGYGHLIHPSSVFALPRGKGRILDEEQQRLAPSAAWSLPIAKPTESLSDLATRAATALRDSVGHEVMEQTTHIIVVHTTLNQQIVESVAGRVQFHLDLKRAMPCAIGQTGSIGMYAALPLIQGLLQDSRQILLIAADKWLYPFFRVFGNFVAYGDGAAAMLFRRGDTSEDVGQVLGFALEIGNNIDDPWGQKPEALGSRLLPGVMQACKKAIQQACIQAKDIEQFISPSFNEQFTGMVSDELGIDRHQRQPHTELGHLSSAESPIALIRARQAMKSGEHRTALIWDVGLCGMAGAMVVRLRGSKTTSIQ